MSIILIRSLYHLVENEIFLPFHCSQSPRARLCCPVSACMVTISNWIVSKGSPRTYTNKLCEWLVIAIKDNELYKLVI